MQFEPVFLQVLWQFLSVRRSRDFRILRGALLAACGGEEIPPRKFGKAAEPHRSKPQKNPEKNIGSNHILILGEEIFLILNF